MHVKSIITSAIIAISIVLVLLGLALIKAPDSLSIPFFVILCAFLSLNGYQTIKNQKNKSNGQTTDISLITKINEYEILNDELKNILQSLDSNIFIHESKKLKTVFYNRDVDQANVDREQNDAPQHICQQYLNDFGAILTDKNFNAHAHIYKQNNEFYECISKPIIWKHQNAILTTVNDISALKQNEEKLIRSENKFRTILEGSPAAICLLGSTKKPFYINESAKKLFEIGDVSALNGQDVSIALRFKNHISEIFEEWEGYDIFSFEDKAGNKKYLVRNRISIEYNEKERTLDTYIDITPLEKARRSEIEANKAKSQFLANMSHEIRTPLNGVIAMADVLFNTLTAESQKETASVIKKSADLLLSIINDILDVSKIEAGKMILEEIPFKLREEMKFCIDSFRFQAKEKNIELEICIEDGVPNKLIGDPFRLRQIISNLLSNAVKFTDKGKIRLIAELVRNNFDTLVLLIMVEDTGIGIPKEKLSLIFQSFTQVDGSTTRQYGGTGLGTTISKQLVEMMEGEIWAESPVYSDNEKNPGSRFCFTIELYNDEKIVKEIDLDSLLDPKQLRTLVVNPDRNNDSPLIKSLQQIGIPIDIKHTQKEALNFLKRQYQKELRTKIVFIEDSREFDGMLFLRELDEQGISEKHIIAVLSSNDMQGNYAKSRRNRADHYIIKPYESDAIFDIIENNFPKIKLNRTAELVKETINRNLSILVAEDNLLNQKVAKTAFKSIGFEIDIAVNGNDAINKIAQKEYDIVFMDFMMPVKDGLEATKELRGTGFNKPIIALTGNALEDDRSKALEAGMNDFITKPFVMSAIKNMLLKWGNS